MTLTPISEGLRLYRERVESILPPDVRGRTWYAQRDWVQDNVPQQSVCDVFVQLMRISVRSRRLRTARPREISATRFAT